MIAKIEIYNDNGDLVDKYDIPPSEEWINYYDCYMIRKYKFSFIYTELQERRTNE